MIGEPEMSELEERIVSIDMAIHSAEGHLQFLLSIPEKELVFHEEQLDRMLGYANSLAMLMVMSAEFGIGKDDGT